jgi:diaminohydroxyphosphoribosylaminopyrimidine deaminase / 5-amino-6-(5-phosphoribosylamino)uracil reductase
MNETDQKYLQRAIRLAMQGRGSTEPNPSVGCAIVKGERIIGQGHTQPFGGPHAEPTALANCTESPAGATAYVTLEPCCHTNKKTPPCAPRLIEAKIARVVVGCLDPNPDVDGKGVKMLREAGIQVDRAPEEIEAEAKQLIAPFMAQTKFHRPYITLKWAQTADGKIAGAGGTRLQISNAAANRVVHQLRSRSDAILVGVNTVLADDPMLTARDVEESRLQTRIVLDSKLRTPIDSRLVQSANEMPVDIYLTPAGFVADRVKPMLSQGVRLVIADADDQGRISIPRLLSRKDFSEITHLLVEPGPTLARSWIDAGAADRVWIIRSPNSSNVSNAPDAAKLPSRYVQTGEVHIDGDVLTEYLDRESDVFYSVAASADLVMASTPKW